MVNTPKSTKKTRADLIVNGEFLGMVLGISKRRVQMLGNEGLPKVGVGKYDLSTCVAWRIDQLTAGSSSDAMEAARLAEIRARTTKHELDITSKRSGLIHAEHARELIDTFGAQIAIEFQSLAGRVRLDKKAKTIVEEEANDALRRLAEFARKLSKKLGDSTPTLEDASAAAE